MDISKSMVNWSKERYGGLNKGKYLHQDVTKPWEYQDYFDGIFTSFAIHELPEKERLAAFGHSYLALKEKGRMVIADFNSQVSGVGKTILLGFFKLFERENLNFFSFDQNEMLKKVGFKRIRTFPVSADMFRITLAHK